MDRGSKILKLKIQQRIDANIYQYNLIYPQIWVPFLDMNTYVGVDKDVDYPISFVNNMNGQWYLNHEF
jgi:hypothetical protein